MKVHNVTDVPGKPMGKDLPGVTKRVMVGRDEGAKNFVIRHFTLEAGAATPYHTHDFEHELFILEGEGALASEEGDQPVRPGDAVYVPPNAQHNFRNAGSTNLCFLCVVPMKGEA